MSSFKIKDYNLADTIAAPATYPAKSALGVVKISGKQAINIVSKIFAPHRKKNIKKVKSHTLHYGWIVEKRGTRNTQTTKHKPLNTEIIDEVLVSVMRGPASYTREDVVEISSHGGAFVTNRIMELVLDRGARLALPGEFTYRALVGGRIDLLQAQGILSIIDTQSRQGLNLAALQLKGDASGKIREVRDQLRNVFIQTEAVINFPEDEVSVLSRDIKESLADIEAKLNRLLEASKQAQVLKEGARCVICGKSNVGKSTLFNCLLKQQRVIVSKWPGTTRDVVEETINVKGIPLRIYDTAGFLEPKDFIAKEAIEKSRQAFDKADLVILVLDATRRMDKDDLFLLEKVKEKSAVLIINKVDLKQKVNFSHLRRFKGLKAKCSALKNIGIDDLEEVIYNSVCSKGIEGQDIVFLNQYQRQILEKSRDKILEAAKFLEQGYTIDFINLALRESLDSLGKLSGEVLSQEVLESIFSNFCIGK
ncbi:MAG: tRNA uridine-5-carboxymethylaminomethyl(34) synthesis GTPase MnmE [Candidatus Omnitrophota bacterium]|nr:MAG: tRNA uridine-5-carboxymethylaminomethyl(34) synthesis GTPase MnmE [Candidatus Omnitrophota bacterium]